MTLKVVKHTQSSEYAGRRVSYSTPQSVPTRMTYSIVRKALYISLTNGSESGKGTTAGITYYEIYQLFNQVAQWIMIEGACRY